MDPEDLFDLVRQRRASDLHLQSGCGPVVRVDGELVFVGGTPLTEFDVERVLQRLGTAAVMDRFEARGEVDFAYDHDGRGRYRVNAYRALTGLSIALRPIAGVAPTLAQIGAPALFSELAELRRGLVLVTGPTGSGKTTTLAAMVDHINEHCTRHVITIEDPIEFLHKNRRSLINQREVGSHTYSFSEALKNALRENPNVLLVGEMRDLETVSLALTAAETGHLVLATLHTASAAKSIDRILDVFPAAAQATARAMLSTSLRAVISQALLRRADGGRVAAFEILLGTPAVRNLIRENNVHQIESMMQLGQTQGMVLMREAVHRLIETGVADRREAESYLRDYDLEQSDRRNGATTRPAPAGTQGGFQSMREPAPERIERRF